MVKAGNRVTFDQDENGNNISRIYNKKKGVKIPIELVGSAYEFEMWVENNKKEEQISTVEVKNKYEPLREDEEPETEEMTGSSSSSFHRLVEAM